MLWLQDTGCAHDLVGKQEVKQIADSIRQAEAPIRFTTANGSPPLADACIDLKCWELDDEDLAPYVLAGTPAVMSIGKRVMHLGYDFIWIGSRKLPPYYVTPSGRIVVMEVIDDIPYLTTGSALCQPRKRGGHIRVPAPMVNAMPAAAPLPGSARARRGGGFCARPGPSGCGRRRRAGGGS